MSAGILPHSKSTRTSLTTVIGSHAMVRPSMVFPFSNENDTLTALLRLAASRTNRLVVAGHATADLAICAHRAELSMSEALGQSPFSADLSAVLAAIKDSSDCVYLSNPNRITGTTFAMSDLIQIGEVVSSGLLIIDEYYFDLCGFSAAPMLERYGNVAILRSMAPRHKTATSDTGYALLSPRIAELWREQRLGVRLTALLEQSMTHDLGHSVELNARIKELHAETLRLGSALTRMGALCRIAPTDFLLVRVASPIDVGNTLAEYGIRVESLAGYAGLGNYVQLKVQTPARNDRVIEAFSRISQDLVNTRTIDRKLIRLRRHAEAISSFDSTPPVIAERLHRVPAYRTEVPTRRSHGKVQAGVK